VWKELGRFDPRDGVIDQPAELLSLFVGDDRTEVLDLDQSFANKDNLGYIRDARDPAVADQLRIKL